MRHTNDICQRVLDLLDLNIALLHRIDAELDKQELTEKLKNVKQES